MYSWRWSRVIREIKLLTWLQMSNFLGINKLRHSKEKKKRLGLYGILASYILLAVVLMVYVAGLTYALILLGLGSLIPHYLGLMVSLVCLFFSIVQVGQQVFEIKSYDKTIVLPVRQHSIVISRFLTLYVSNAALSLGITGAGAVVCAVMGLPWLSCLALLAGGALLPLLPMTLGLIVGGVIYAVASRLPGKNLVVILLSMALVIGTLALSMGAGSMTEADETRLLQTVAGMLYRCGEAYPPLGWFARGVFGDAGRYGLFALGSVGAFLLVSWVLGLRFRSICSALSGHRAGGRFVLEAQRSGPVFRALYRNELRRYFSCSIYVTNTLVGYLMAVLLAGATLTGQMGGVLPVTVVAYAVGALMGLAPTTICALSMEGKQWWLAQHLPVRAKAVFDSKLMVHLTLAVPCTLIAQGLLLTGCHCWQEVTVVLLIPAAYALFCGVAAMTVNIKMPMLQWDTPSQPVKQSKAQLVGMLVSLLSGGVPVALTLLRPQWSLLTAMVTAAMLLAVTWVLYRWIGSRDLQEIG